MPTLGGLYRDQGGPCSAVFLQEFLGLLPLESPMSWCLREDARLKPLVVEGRSRPEAPKGWLKGFWGSHSDRLISEAT